MSVSHFFTLIYQAKAGSDKALSEVGSQFGSYMPTLSGADSVSCTPSPEGLSSPKDACRCWDEPAEERQDLPGLFVSSCV